MKPLGYLMTFVALAMSSDALALGASANVRIVDRDSGAALSTYYYRGEYWVAGKPGSRYAIEIRNRLGARLLAVTSVDGVNVISGATAGWEQTGYVFEPGESYQITGWRKSHEEVAAFTFADASNSYAAQTGRPANIGVIGVALFRERQPERVYVPPKIARAPPASATAPNESRESSGATREMQTDQSAAVAKPSARAPLPAPKLGTGHGAREYSYVEDTEFQRMQTEPNEVVRIRYDSFENLVAMGIVKRGYPTRPGPNPFPGSQERQFVPDPPG